MALPIPHATVGVGGLCIFPKDKEQPLWVQVRV